MIHCNTAIYRWFTFPQFKSCQSLLLPPTLKKEKRRNVWVLSAGNSVWWNCTPGPELESDGRAPALIIVSPDVRPALDPRPDPTRNAEGRLRRADWAGWARSGTCSTITVVCWYVRWSFCARWGTRTIATLPRGAHLRKILAREETATILAAFQHSCWQNNSTNLSISFLTLHTKISICGLSCHCKFFSDLTTYQLKHWH